ncbi:MAG: trigger factor [Succinivibrio sp.]|nr:trigger factor [Succinivibrio sp.]
MQVSVEKKEGLEQEVTITVPYAEAEKAYKKSLKEVGKNVRVDGFRKGHIPNNILENRYGNEIIGQAIDQLINDTVFEALKEQKIEYVGRPEIKLADNAADCFKQQTDFVYSAVVEVENDFELKPLENLKIKKVICEIEDADVDRMVEHLREQQGKWQVKDGLACAEGNSASIDFLGKMNGEPFEGGKAENFTLQFGKTQMIPGFSEQILGHKAGDKFTIKVTFPAEYHAPDLASKDAEFDITVNNVSELVKPEVNADFLKIYGVKDGSVETFRSELRKNMEREEQQALSTANLNSISDAIYAEYKDLLTPKFYVESEINNLKEKMKRNIQMYGGNPNKLPDMFNDNFFRADAEKNARLSMVFAKIASANKLLEPSEEYVDKQIDLMAGAYENREEFKRNVRNDKRMLAQFKNRAIEQQLLDFIQSKAQVEEKKVTFFDLVDGKF